MSFYNATGLNRLTFACSDALHTVGMSGGVNEETARLLCRLQLFDDGDTYVNDLKLQIRIDTRPLPVADSLTEVQRWWSLQPGYRPAEVPAAAKRPMYSTWYSFHQQVDRELILRQCELAKDLGCETVILDDGWQTLDKQRGYAYCGDWEPLGMPDIGKFVDGVHALGMKCLLWYAVPFVGIHSKAFPRLKDKFLSYRSDLGYGVLDPRFSSVRKYLTEIYVKALEEWKLDGFKLDFVDALEPTAKPAEQPSPSSEERDYDSVAEAADQLLSGVMSELRKRKPDVLIEFRQTYVGPLMRKYGNMLRAGDCPNDALNNRQRIVDIRLLAGNTATHSDMLMWNPAESVAHAAEQLLNVIFSVPQISMLLHTLPPEHQKMLSFWLEYWNSNSSVLMDGELEIEGIESVYRQVSSKHGNKRITAVYADVMTKLPPDSPAEWDLINVSGRDHLYLEITPKHRLQVVTMVDAQGSKQRGLPDLLLPGLHQLHVPSSGLARLNVIAA